MTEQRWLVYVLVSSAGRRTYVGITTDPERRLAQHNGVRKGGARTTRRGRPWRIGALYGPCGSRAEAQRLERRLKKLRGEARLRADLSAGSDPS
ncbi:MAG: GIY-YIG nuclease family protein [Myxococcota bacterium]